MSNRIKEIYVTGGQGQTVTIPLKGHGKRSKAKWLKKYGPDAKAKGRIADAESAWEQLEKAVSHNKAVDKAEKEEKSEEVILPPAGGSK